MGQRSAPEMPECIFKAAHDTCKPMLIQTPSLPLVSFSHLSSSAFSVVSRIEPDILDSEQDDHLREKKNKEKKKKKSEREQEPGAEAGMRQVFCVCVCVLKCAHVCGVHCASRLSAPSMRPLLLLGLVVVSAALPGCSALFSPAVADARHLRLDTLAQLLAFCCSADGEA